MSQGAASSTLGASVKETFKLVQILLATGEAFSEASDVIIPFIRPDDPHRHSTVFSISEAPDQLYKAFPGKMLDLLAAVVGEVSPGSVFGLDKALSRLRAVDPELANTRKFQKLTSYAIAIDEIGKAINPNS